MPGTPASPATLLVIFGASGDLAQRMLLPSLYGLQHAGLLPEGLRILGTARSELDDAAFRANVADAVRAQVPAADLDDAALDAMLARIGYQPADSSDGASMERLGARIRELRNGDILYHLSTAPRFYGPICDALGALGLAGAGTRVMLEKPIGHDFASAMAINDGVACVFDEDRVFRVDHYLG
jgi:glucose-6-phosphate 1-dehydrogenase